MKLLLLLLLGILLSMTSANTCPKTARGALLGSKKDLLACDLKMLKLYYIRNGCCINELAECRHIELAMKFKGAEKTPCAHKRLSRKLMKLIRKRLASSSE